MLCVGAGISATHLCGTDWGGEPGKRFGRQRQLCVALGGHI